MAGQGLGLSAAGIAAGLIAAFGRTRLPAGMAAGGRPTDPATFATAAGVFPAIAAAGSRLPARRAAKLDPTAALREE